ncbi:MAG: DNA polymerase Y family protein [Gammaproteobacteria bacterium]
MLWLSVYLPHLSLERLLRGGVEDTGGQPLVVYTSNGSGQWIHARNRAAARLGIAPGMSLGAAASLADTLHSHVYDPDAELAALQGIAAWAEQFTSTISLQPPQGLLLEIEGSLSLFGGAESLRSRVVRGLRELGYRPRTAVAPTPLGAWLLARAAYSRPVTDRTVLAAILRQLPIEILERPEYLLQSLRAMGMRTIGDCLHLPRAGLARRLGPEFVQYLDRALGRIPEPRPAFRQPQRFQRQLTLPAEVSATEALLFASRRLLLELSGFLSARGKGVQQIRLALLHHHASPTRLDLGLVRPSRDAEHLLGLLRERLERLELRAPVAGIGLEAEHLATLNEDNRDLFTAARSQRQDWPQLVERLRARLGHDAVRGVAPVAEHRPERAWRYCDPGQFHDSGGNPARPLWLLRRPEPLKVCEGLPWLDGRLLLERGPERIESGWWDGRDAARDYFVARNEQHERFWVFRELRKPGRWFLHGVFG